MISFQISQKILLTILYQLTQVLQIRGMTDFSDQFRKIIMRYNRIGYNLNVMRQSACLVINPITVDGYAALNNCTPVNRRQTP